MLYKKTTRAVEILAIIRSVSENYNKNDSLVSLNSIISNRIYWEMFNGMSNVIVSNSEDNMFIIIEISSIFNDVIIDRYKFAKVFI